MDRGLWATWYNLDDADRHVFLDWAHESYLPALRQLPGVAWVAHFRNEGGGPRMDAYVSGTLGRTEEDIGDGGEYAILVGASSPHTFLNPFILEHQWPDDFARFLDMRKGERTGIFVEEARVTGPDGALKTPGSAPGPYIQLGSFRMRTVEKDLELGKWYAQYRLPYMAQMSGCAGTRKYAGVGGWAKHLILYEFTSAEARMRHFEEDHETHDLDAGVWHNNVTPFTVHTPGSPIIGPRIWPRVE